MFGGGFESTWQLILKGLPSTMEYSRWLTLTDGTSVCGWPINNLSVDGRLVGEDRSPVHILATVDPGREIHKQVSREPVQLKREISVWLALFKVTQC